MGPWRTFAYGPSGLGVIRLRAMSFLEQITASRRADARARSREAGTLRSRIADLGPTRGFELALRVPGLSLIAELKRSSPSVGAINTEVDPAERARAYETGGAHAMSVLTEPSRFGGSLDDLRVARFACDLPILRKDFLSEPLHLLEARAAGADAILLIVAALDRHELADLHAEATELGLAVLVEVHDAGEVGIALDAGAQIVGVNTRNLATLEVEPKQVARVRPEIPPGIVVVGESGIKTRADVAALEEVGVDAILVGEALMRSADVASSIATLLGR